MQDNNKKLEFLKKLTFRQVFYPSASIAFALLIIVIFFFSVNFIVENINKTFYIPSDSEVAGQITVFDKTNYIVVAKKLGISVAESEPQVIKEEQPELAEVPPVEAPVVETPVEEVPAPVVEVDKKTLKIGVYNTTPTSGLAAKLKTVITEAGFDVLETGNKTPALETTTIKVKESLLGSPLVEEIKTLVGTKYQTVTEVIGNESAFDIEVVIGKK